MVLKLYIIRTVDGLDFPLPSYTSKHHVGLILQAAIPAVVKLEPGECIHLPVGFGIGVPDGFCGQIVSLLDVVKETGIIVMGSPQIVNPADRSALFVLIQNASQKQQILRRGQAIAQLLIMPVHQIAWNEIGTALDNSKQTAIETMMVKNISEIKLDDKAVHRRKPKSIRERIRASDNV